MVWRSVVRDIETFRGRSRDAILHSRGETLLLSVWEYQRSEVWYIITLAWRCWIHRISPLSVKQKSTHTKCRYLVEVQGTLLTSHLRLPNKDDPYRVSSMKAKRSLCNTSQIHLQRTPLLKDSSWSLGCWTWVEQSWEWIYLNLMLGMPWMSVCHWNWQWVQNPAWFIIEKSSCLMWALHWEAGLGAQGPGITQISAVRSPGTRFGFESPSVCWATVINLVSSSLSFHIMSFLLPTSKGGHEN